MGPPPAAHWLNLSRLRFYGALLLALMIAIEAGTAWDSFTRYGIPGGGDFSAFWAASRLWLEGMPLAAYSHDTLAHSLRQVLPALPPRLPGPFWYPPHYFLLLRPLALVPFGIALALFDLATFCVFFPLIRKVLPMRAALLPLLAFPGIWVNVMEGQNGLLTAGLALGALLLLNTRPVLAGVCIGLLSIKPQLAVLFPLALACAGMWTAFAAAGVTVALFTGLALLVFGPAALTIFLHGVGAASQLMAAGVLPWTVSASLFSALRLLHVPEGIAYAAQGCQALAAAAAMAWIWRRTEDLAVRATALVAATCMISPYLFNYDTAWLGIAIALLTAKALRDGWLRWEREVLLAAWLYPALGSFSSELVHTNVGPPVFAALLLVAARRAYAGSSPGTPQAGNGSS